MLGLECAEMINRKIVDHISDINTYPNCKAVSVSRIDGKILSWVAHERGAREHHEKIEKSDVFDAPRT